MQTLLKFPFENRVRAQADLKALIRHLPEPIQNRLDLLLSTSPAPEVGVQAFTRLRESQPEAFRRLVNSPVGLRYLTVIFTHSRFLTERILEHPDWVEELVELLPDAVSGNVLRDQLEWTLGPKPPDPMKLATFRRRNILRIFLNDILGIAPLAETTAALSELADVILNAAYRRIYDELCARYGPPLTDVGEPSYFSVIALGKLGGAELNYSSDIDLMYVYSDNGETAGPIKIANNEFFNQAATRLTAMLSSYTPRGLCYRVDLRLRPEGSLGEVCVSLDGARRYYESRARDWELQMLIKARVAAGHWPTGQALLDSVEPLIYSTTLDFRAVEQLSLTRDRLDEKLTNRQIRRGVTKLRQKNESINVKLERGGIRDIEFLVQCLQRLYGGTVRWVRHGGTLLALARLHDRGLLSETEYGHLATAYRFLRNLEHRLQLEDDLQTHTLPKSHRHLEMVARRMPQSGGTAQWLLNELKLHLKHVSEIYQRVVGSRSGPVEVIHRESQRQTPMVVLTLDQRAPKVAEVLARSKTGQRASAAFEHFLERLANDPRRLEKLNANPEIVVWTLDLFEHSPFFADELIRTPELAGELAHPPGEEPAPEDLEGLRRWYRREMLRIQAESICRSRPVFDTLERTSDLADRIIQRVYGLAVKEVRESFPTPGYDAANRMWVVALGRLGTREFDLGSDADLVFVLADSDQDQIVFWTRVAERMLSHISAYTGLGVLFTVDTRLRPNGSAGPLVITESAFREYFAKSAEAWEGLTYMKSRIVAGNYSDSESFLHQLQEADWKIYGQGGRSRADLMVMRMRLEKEQGQSHPLKAGKGGYYDIDFLLMYLRLKSAGVYFRVLNTPQRVEILKALGMVDKNHADFLLKAATFYRAVDHGIRVLSGHAEGKLPKAEAQRQALAELVSRWSEFPLSYLPELAVEVRTMFEKTFA
jgi:glutamate-ammonia-ligase adenylyltransferase